MRPEPGPRLTERIIGLAMNVHRAIGPGLLEAVYQRCLAVEFGQAGLGFEREVPLELNYNGVRFPSAYKADFIVERSVLLELKSIEQIHPVHEAQTRTYLRLSGCDLALLMNFNTVLLKDGLRRFIASAAALPPTQCKPPPINRRSPEHAAQSPGENVPARSSPDMG